jgi:hypothetical protein
LAYYNSVSVRSPTRDHTFSSILIKVAPEYCALVYSPDDEYKSIYKEENVYYTELEYIIKKQSILDTINQIE